MRVIDAAATRDALPFERLIPALRAMFESGCEVPSRHVHAVAGADGELAGTLLVMPAWQPGAYLGIKTVGIFPGNASQGLPALHSTYLLYDARTGMPLAMMDGNEITSRRTAAASALAASYLAPKDARHLLVVGAGRVARLLPAAYKVVRPGIERVTVWSRNPEAARGLVDELRAGGFEGVVDAAIDLSSAVREADIVSTATLATEPLIHGALLRAGTHLDLIGGFTPAMREADDACFGWDVGLWVDTGEALMKSGDLLGPMSREVFSAGDVRGTFADLVRIAVGSVHDREGIRRTVFKSVGTALEDLVAARLVVEHVE